MEAALEAGAEDVIAGDDGSIEVLTPPAEFEAVKNALEAGLKPEVAEVTMPRRGADRALDRRRGRAHAEAARRGSRTWTTCRRSTTTPSST